MASTIDPTIDAPAEFRSPLGFRVPDWFALRAFLLM
jgi:hypothetical protein